MDIRLLKIIVILLATFLFGQARITNTIEPAQGDKLYNAKDKLQDQVCGSCLEASRKAQTALTQGDLLDDVETLAFEVCDALPLHLKIKCLEKSNASVYQARSSLQELYNENSLCNTTGLCFHELKLAKQSPLTETNQFLEIDPEACDACNKTCDDCLKTVKGVMVVVKQSKIKSRIIDALIDYCEDEGGKHKDCKKQVNSYGVGVMSNLTKLNPIDLCQMIGECEEVLPE